jgi:ribosomal protein L28
VFNANDRKMAVAICASLLKSVKLQMKMKGVQEIDRDVAEGSSEG